MINCKISREWFKAMGIFPDGDEHINIELTVSSGFRLELEKQGQIRMYHFDVIKMREFMHVEQESFIT